MNITLDNEVNIEIVVMTAYKVGIVLLFLKNNRMMLLRYGYEFRP